MLKNNRAFLTLALVASLYVSCSNDDGAGPGNVDVDKIAASTDAAMTASADYAGIAVLTYAIAPFIPGLGKVSAPPDTLTILDCPTVIFDRDARTALFDFGAGCQAYDGVTRSGSISISYSGSIRSNAILNLTFNDFKANGQTYSGTAAITVSSGAVQVSLVEATATNSAGETTTIDATLTVKAAIGNPVDISDDVYLVGGNVTVTDKDGDTYSFTITEDLEFSLTCAYPKKGKMEGVNSDNIAVKVDFFPVNGECDDIVAITIGSVTREIRLGS